MVLSAHTHTFPATLHPRGTFHTAPVRSPRICSGLAPLDRGDHVLRFELLNVSPSGQGRQQFKLPRTQIWWPMCLTADRISVGTHWHGHAVVISGR